MPNMARAAMKSCRKTLEIDDKAQLQMPLTLNYLSDVGGQLAVVFIIVTYCYGLTQGQCLLSMA